ncbi:MAG: dimethyl sulfoxide reductase anchor subunit [Burkholderiales bacterium]|nr:dimethyl sulfoxide reductase anchor subunit [Burkholderiales bacterium]
MLKIGVDPRTGEAFLQAGPAAPPASLKRAVAPAPARPLWEPRTEERPYAFLPEVPLPEKNRWGEKIDLVERTEGRASLRPSLHINDNPTPGRNPHRGKQHGFYFTADNCIGCHACEAACSEKNENPPHLAFRSVGYLEGGSWPDFKRLNISMACNHCDDPVCLKGCPTRAYTKHAEYGAVLQDPDTCFGCGYCTWVCPYNAPQLDPVKGQVSKCNMCVDRLEVGLKPACVAACVGNALDFGVIETVPENREQARIDLPGFPSPEITHPNIRFQQIRELPDELKRTDSMPVKYRRDESGGYRPAVDPKTGHERQWNLRRLSSRENPLVLFTLTAQMAAGAFALAFLGAALGPALGMAGFAEFARSPAYLLLAAIAFASVCFGLFMSTMHLGKPRRFYRGFNNLRHSPVSREGLGIALFIAGLGAHLVFTLPQQGWLQHALASALGFALPGSWQALAAAGAAAAGTVAVVAAAAGLYYMVRCYRIPARPFWNHWQVGAAFGGSTLALGALLAAAVMLPTLAGPARAPVAMVCAALLLAGVLVEAIGLVAHARALARADHEGAASHYVQRTVFGHTYRARNVLLGVNALLALAALAGFASGAAWAPVALLLAGLLQVAASLVGRALFYVLVIPTTMPGAFFWKNKGFEEHARAIGLDLKPQVGVAPLRH